MSVQPFMVWPDIWDRHSIKIDFQVPESAFTVLRPDDRSTWDKLRGVERPVVLDPCAITTYDSHLRSAIEASSAKLAVGWSAVRLAISALRLR